MKKILVIGSSNIDYTYVSDSFPLEGETLLAKECFTNLGGKGLNQAAAAAKMRADVSFLTCLGNDANKDVIINAAKELNINIVPIIKNSPTGNAFINVNSKTKENKILVFGGANVLFTKQDIDNNLDLIKQSDYILLQLEIPLDVVKYIVKIAKELGKITFLNPAPYVPLDDELLKNIDYITPNEGELKLIADNFSDDYLENAKHVQSKFNINNVIVTLGDKGSILINKEKIIKIDPYKVNAMDTTGAGDCFNGTLLAFLSKGYSLKDSLDKASLASALSVTKLGALKSYPTLEEIEK